jgi:hypothetical protein
MEELVYLYPLGKLDFYDFSDAIEDKSYKNYNISKKDKKTLKELAIKKAEIAELKIHKEKINMWKELNKLGEVRPLVWINEMPWHELNVENELTLKTTAPFAKFLETRLRRNLYCCEHMPVDMIVEPVLPCYYVTKNTGFGMSEIVDTVKTDKKSDIKSRKYTTQIKNEEDIEKIKNPKISHDKKATEEKYEVMKDIFGGILEIEKKGVPGFWFSPWDELIRWWGVQGALTDLILRPELVHKVMDRLTKAYLSMLDQYEDQNLLALNNCNYRIGSGGLSYSDELPQNDFNPSHVRTIDLWGSGAAQIFSDVSPEMHYEFALQYGIRWMKRFGLNYYGCCEPLDKKIDILKKIPRLRKISMSPWANLDIAAEKIGGDYVISYKPNPAIFVEDSWEPEEIKKDLTNNLNKIKKCKVEILMKDISTVKYKPQRLWEWAKIAMEVSEKFA